MDRVEPIMENALGRVWSVRMGAVEAAQEDWVRCPTRKNRAWARLLARSAAGDVNSLVRNSAIEVLSVVGTASDRRLFVAALDDSSDLVRSSAVTGLGWAVKRPAERYILRATQDGSTMVRRYAWIALSDAIGTDSEVRLREAADREVDDEVAVGIWAALLTLGHPEAQARLESFAASGNSRINSWAQDSLDQASTLGRQSRS